MPVLVKALGYYSHKGGKATHGLSKLKAHLKYLEHGKEHPNQPRGFSETKEYVSRDEFVSVVEKQPERGVIAHKLVISLSQDEQERLGVNMRQLVRNMMADWGRRLGRVLDWIGFEHLDGGHPHVHVVVGGYAGEKQVGLYERDLIHLRDSGELEKNRQARLERATPLRTEHDLDREVAKFAREAGPRLASRERSATPRSRHPDYER
jgi:hypothetical protein